MLYEILTAKKHDNGIPVKCFTDEYFDLTVWFDDNRNIISFQLTHDKFHNPRALTWKQGHGFRHDAIDDGETPGRFKKSPVLIADGEFPKDTVVKRFEKESREIDPDIAGFILKKISEA